MRKSNMKLAMTIFVSGLAVVLSVLVNFFLTPFITDNVGTEAYGFITLAKTAVGYASIITIAFTTFVVRFVSIEYHKRNFEGSRAYFSSSILAVSIVSVIILISSVILIMYFEKILNIPPNLTGTVKVLFLLVFISFCISTITIPFTSACYIQNKLTVLGIIRILALFIEAITLFLLFSLFKTELWYVGIGLLFASIASFVGNIIVTKKLTPELVFSHQYVSISKVKDLVQTGVWQSVNSLGTVLNSGLDLWVSNIMLSALAMGQISIVKSTGMLFVILYSTISQAFQPRMLKTYASEDKHAFLNELQFSMKVSGFFTAITFAGFFALGELYFRLWLPNQDYRLLYILTIITILSSVVDGVIYPAYYVNTLTTKKKIPSILTICAGVINVIAMILLIDYTSIGVYAIVWTTTVLSFLLSFMFNPIYCAVTLNYNWYTLYPLIFRHILSCVLLTLLFEIITNFIHPSTWGGLLSTSM